jgi:hypothetical protein
MPAPPAAFNNAPGAIDFAPTNDGMRRDKSLIAFWIGVWLTPLCRFSRSFCAVGEKLSPNVPDDIACPSLSIRVV